MTAILLIFRSSSSRASLPLHAPITSNSLDDFAYGRLENDVFAVCLPYQEENIDLLVKAIQIKLKKVNKDYNIKVSCGVYVIKDRAMDVSEMYDRAFLAAIHLRSRAHTWRHIYWSNRPIMPFRSYTGINSPGEIIPLSGCFHRTRTSDLRL